MGPDDEGIIEKKGSCGRPAVDGGESCRVGQELLGWAGKSKEGTTLDDDGGVFRLKYREIANDGHPCTSQQKFQRQQRRAGRNLRLHLLLDQHISLMLAISSMQRDSASTYKICAFRPFCPSLLHASAVRNHIWNCAGRNMSGWVAARDL